MAYGSKSPFVLARFSGGRRPLCKLDNARRWKATTLQKGLSFSKNDDLLQPEGLSKFKTALAPKISNAKI
jgi:hypothetical protein